MSLHEQFADDLTLYALGTLEGSERAALEVHLKQRAACRRELHELRGDIGLLGMATMGPAPPPGGRALAIGLGQGTARAHGSQTIVALVVAGAGSVAVVLAVVSIALWRQNNALRKDLAQQLAQSSQNQAEVERAREVLALLSAPDDMRVTLVATNAKPQPQGKAIYRPQTGSLVFLASNFAALPPKKAYELWLLPASGAAPMPAGVFKPDARGSAAVLMPTLPKDLEAKGFAITIEPEAETQKLCF